MLVMTKRIKMTLEVAQLLEAAIKAEEKLDNDLRMKQVVLGRFPLEVLEAMKIDDLEVVTSISVLAKLMEKHKLSAAVVSGLHDLICNPVAVYDSATKKGSVVVLTVHLIGGDPIIAAIVINTPDALGKPNMHWLTSAYAKDNHAKFHEWEAAGLLRWRPATKKAA